MKSVQISINYDIETAKAIARRVLEQYAKNNQYLIDSNDVSPMIQDAYKCIGKSYVPTTDDTKGFAKILDKDGDGQVSLSDLERHCIELFCRKSSQYFGGSNPGVPGRSYDLGVGSGPYEQLKKASPPSRTMADQDHLLEVVRRVFKKFDEDGNGYIDPSELKHLLEETYRGLGIKKVITDRDVEHYLNLVDSNHDGKVSLQEFENLFLKSMEKWSNLRFVSSDNILRDSTNSPYRSLANSIHLGESEEKYKKSSFSFPRKMPEPHQKHLEQVRRIFNKFDKDRNGFIDADELRDLLEETYSGLGIKKNITNEDVKHYLKIVDTNNDGRISIQEYEDIFIRSLDRWSGKFL